MRRERVKFTATKKEKRSTDVSFTTRSGEEVDFVAKKPVEVHKRVNFLAKPKKGK